MSMPPAGQFRLNPIAQQHHENGLHLETTTTHYHAAHTSFRIALSELRGDSTPDARLQASRIIRDDGFTDVRAALHSGDPLLFDDAEIRLGQAAATVKPLLDRNRGFTTSQERQLKSEYGATLGCLGRAAVARQVALGFLPTSDSNRASHNRREQHFFGKREAHRHLKAGSNMYYLVSNAMQGARAERLNGKALRMVPWFGRAAVGLVRAVRNDRQNLRPAMRTAGALFLDLRSKKRAAQSVKQRP